jgi:hypothetical protein
LGGLRPPKHPQPPTNCVSPNKIILEFAPGQPRKLQGLLVAIMHKWQVGQFFLLMGILLLVFYFATSQVDSPILYYFCFGMVFLLFGIYLMWIGRNPTVASDRFHFLRRMSEGKKKPQKNEENKPEGMS